MTGAKFLRAIRRLARTRGPAVRFEAGRGKGSHGRLYRGERFTTLKDRTQEIGPGLLRALLRQIGLGPDDLED
jgi:predicted RNA binding protein YcfA (HicA-like mRNA interferase family)